MIDRRKLISGLAAGAASTALASCGGSLATNSSSPSKSAAKEAWKSPFSNDYDTAPATTARRTTPATVEELMQKGPLKEMTLGQAGAKVTMIEYFSLTCPVCHAFHKNTWPTFKTRYIDTGRVYYIAREFPIGRSSGNATIALRCIDENQYFSLLNLYLAEQRRWVSQDVRLDAIHNIAAPLGLPRAKFDSCLANQDMINGINEVKQRGRELGVIGTPTFFINGKQLRGAMTMARLQAEIDPLLA